MGTMAQLLPYGHILRAGRLRQRMLEGSIRPQGKRCANGTLDLYFAVDFFCCDQDAKGFEVNSNGFVGCAPLDVVLPQGQTALSIIVSGSGEYPWKNVITGADRPLPLSRFFFADNILSDCTANIVYKHNHIAFGITVHFVISHDCTDDRVYLFNRTFVFSNSSFHKYSSNCWRCCRRGGCISYSCLCYLVHVDL